MAVQATQGLTPVQGLVGLAALIALAWILSENRRAVAWRLVAAGLSGQALIAFLAFKVPAAKSVFLGLNGMVDALQAASRAGTSFVFGYVGGGPAPFAEVSPGQSFILAFQALPLVLIMSALSALLYHWRVLPLLVRAFAAVLERVFGLGGAVGMSAAAMPFLGMIESPLLIRPYLSRLSRGELFVVMTGGMSTIAGTMLVLYASFLAGVIPDPVGHLVTASLVSIPASIMIARIMIPDQTRTSGGIDASPHEGAMDAIVRGTLDGVGLLTAIIAMLIVLVGLVHLANGLLALGPELAGSPVTLQRLLGLALAPLAWAMGIPWAEAATAGQLLGTKIVLNELLAYLNLSHLPMDALSAKSRLIVTYALCSFANLGSMGILMAGLSALAPERRGEIVGLGGKSLLAGTITTCMTAALIGLLV